MLNHIDNPNREQNKAHLNHLIQIALADGKLDDAEKEMLHRFGRNMGLTDPEIEGHIESVKSQVFCPPYELSKRFEQMYELMKMLLSDGWIDNKEMRLASLFAFRYGFSEEETPKLLGLLLGGIKQNKVADELFETYKRNRTAAN